MIAVVAVVASVIDGRVVPLSAQLVLRYMYVADVGYVARCRTSRSRPMEMVSQLP